MIPVLFAEPDDAMEALGKIGFFLAATPLVVFAVVIAVCVAGVYGYGAWREDRDAE